MHTFYYWLSEMVRNKTDLTQWMLSIKANHKDPLLYFALADYLEEHGEPEDVTLSQMFRIALESQAEDRKAGVSKAGVYGKYAKFKNLEEQLKIDLAAKGFETDWISITNRKPIVPKSNIYMSNVPTDKMASTINVTNREGDYKDTQHNNVAWHDLNDRSYQIWALAAVAKKIFYSELVVGPKINYPKECTAGFLISQTFNSDARDRLLNGENINYNNIRTYREAVEDIRELIQQTYDCCQFWGPSDRQELLETVQYFHEDLENQPWGHALFGYEALMWIAEQFIQALSIQDCQKYKVAIATIMRRTRTRESWQLGQ